jgi:hypothetical protein
MWYKMDMGEAQQAKARWLDILPTTHEGMEVFIIRDPEGLTDKSLVVSRDILFLISLMDGTRTVGEIQEAYMRASGGVLVQRERITSVIETMDAHFLLLNERYERQMRMLREAYDALPCRNAFLAGKGYPGDAAALRDLMAAMIDHGDGAHGRERMKGLIAPHIDYERGNGVYRQAYRFLPDEDNTLFVVFGTCHKFAPKLWNIALRDVLTPFGTVRGASEVGGLVRKHGRSGAMLTNGPTGNEHSHPSCSFPSSVPRGHERFEVLSVPHRHSLHELHRKSRRRTWAGLSAGELTAHLREILKGHEGDASSSPRRIWPISALQFGDPPGRIDACGLEQKRPGAPRRHARADATGFFKPCAPRKAGQEADLRPSPSIPPLHARCVRGQRLGLRAMDPTGMSSVSFAGVVFS